MARCPLCEAPTLEQTTTLETRVFGQDTFVGEVTCWRCSSCGEEIFDAEERQRWGDALAEAVLEHGGPTGQKFRFLRKHAELPAKELAGLLGVTPETVSRWEGGKHEIPLAVWALLGVLVREHIHGETTMLERLRRVNRPASREVRVVLARKGEGAAGVAPAAPPGIT